MVEDMTFSDAVGSEQKEALKVSCQLSHVIPIVPWFVFSLPC